MSNFRPARSNLTLLEARQLLGSIRQANEEIVEAVLQWLTGQSVKDGRLVDARILSAIRNHRAAISQIWQPMVENDGISAAKPMSLVALDD